MRAELGGELVLRVIGVVLWVDDRPENSRYGQSMRTALGITVVMRTSSEEALPTLASRPFDLIVSDLHRGSDPAAGFAMLESARAAGFHLPCVYYVAHVTSDRAQEATRLGAAGMTNQPTGLLRLVTQAMPKAEPVTA